MKTNPINRVCIALAILALTIPAMLSRADVAFYENTFDDSTSFQPNAPNFNPPPISVRFDNGTTTPQATFNAAWSANDAVSNVNSGSVEASWTWSTNDGNGQCDFTMDLFPNGTSGPQTNVTSLSFDIMVDSSSATDVFNGYGDFQIVTRDDGYGYNVVG